MPKDSNYLEEAIAFIHSADPHVSCIARTLYRNMVAEPSAPHPGFNMFYFLQTVIRLWLLQHPEIIVQGSSFPLHCEPIRGINWPSRISLSRNEHDLVHQLIRAVESDSNADGDEFDVSYAVRMIVMAFDIDSGDLLSPAPTDAEIIEADYDYWISGFVTRV